MSTSRIFQMSQMSMTMSQMSMTMWKMCMMFDISQMTYRVQVTVEKIFWKMFLKKFIQMENMQTMIISMGELTEKLFRKVGISYLEIGYIFFEAIRLRTQAWTWNWVLINKFSETTSNSKLNMGIVFTILTAATKQQNLSGLKMQSYQR